MFILDTNVISELRRESRADANVLSWAKGFPANQFFLSAITVLELQYGVLLKARKDPKQGQLLQAWLDQQILPHFAARILSIDEPVALRCAALHAPDPRSDRDALIGATALVHGMTVVTHNVSDFEGMGTSLLDPWEVRA